MADYPYISLYTGAGGLDLGLEAAGFRPSLCVENDEDARSTLRANRRGWRLSNPGDVHALSPEEILAQADLKEGEARLVAGGPPCQPFSKSGQWANGAPDELADRRAKTIDRFFEVVEHALPDAFLLENVPLLAGRSGAALQYIRDRVESLNRVRRMSYSLAVVNLRCEQHGVPQQRHRVFLVGARDGSVFVPPAALFGEAPGLAPFRTAWDAIGDLALAQIPAELKPSGRWADLLPTIPEGHNYEWHTSRGGGRELFGHRTRYWSFLLKLAKNRPSWTIQAEPGPATGPFHWENRLLSIRELCRLQTFPDDYSIAGHRRSAVRQVGNAVPPVIGEVLGLEIRRQLLADRTNTTPRLIPPSRPGMPGPEAASDTPKKYLDSAGPHADHPGVGLGPRAKMRQDAETSAQEDVV